MKKPKRKGVKMRAAILCVLFVSTLLFAQHNKNNEQILEANIHPKKVSKHPVLQHPGEYVSDTIDAQAGYMGGKFDPTFEKWQMKHLRPALLGCLNDKTLKYVCIDLVNEENRQVEYRVRFEIEYSDNIKSSYWKDTSAYRRDVYHFGKENKGKKYQVAIMIALHKQGKNVDGFVQAKNYPKMSDEVQTRVQLKRAIEVGSINVNASVVGIVVKAGM